MNILNDYEVVNKDDEDIREILNSDIFTFDEDIKNIGILHRINDDLLCTYNKLINSDFNNGLLNEGDVYQLIFFTEDYGSSLESINGVLYKLYKNKIKCYCYTPINTMFTMFPLYSYSEPYPNYGFLSIINIPPSHFTVINNKEEPIVNKEMKVLKSKVSILPDFVRSDYEEDFIEEIDEEEFGNSFFYTLLDEKGEKVGFAIVHHKNETDGYLSYISIAKSHRGKGYSIQLIKYLQKNYTKLLGHVGVSNIPSLRMFLRCEFRINLLLPNYYSWYKTDSIDGKHAYQLLWTNTLDIEDL